MIVFDKPDEALYEDALTVAKNRIQGMKGVGTLAEKSVHAMLKYYYAPNDKYHEVNIDGFVADACVDGEIYEIQTRNFYVMKRKLEAFLKEHEVTVIYPVSVENRISWIDPETGEIFPGTKKKTAKKPFVFYREIYSIRQFLGRDNLHFAIALLSTEDSRLLDGYGKDRKIRATKLDRFPCGFEGEIFIDSPSDFVKLLPDGLPESFTTADFAHAAAVSRDDATKALIVLREAKIVGITGKNKNENIYTVL